MNMNTPTHGALVLSLLLALPCSAQVGPPPQERFGDEADYDAALLDFDVGRQVAAEELHPLVVQGTVFQPDGRPASGAVVVSSAGGLAEVQADGSFRLEVRVAPGVSALQLSAAANGPQGPLTARETVHGIPSGGRATSGPMHLTSGAGCALDWVPTFGGHLGVSGPVEVLALFDDGSGGGPALYLGGSFLTAGGKQVDRIVKWDGQSWSGLGGGVNGEVHALAVFDDGQGGGPALYVGGGFTVAGGQPANHIARWDGQAWSTLGSGIVLFGQSRVHDLIVFDDGLGAGPALYAGGGFLGAGGLSAKNIARWDGQTWSPLGSGLGGTLHALAVFDDGSGSGAELYAGGSGLVLGSNFAKWNGQSWSALGSGVTGGAVYAMTIHDDGQGSGPALYIGGDFTTAGSMSINRLARWNGQHYSGVGFTPQNAVRALAVFDDGQGAGPRLYAGGWFSAKIMRWNGQTWSGLGGYTDDQIHALIVHDDGSGGGPALYAGGRFQLVGGRAANRIAKWTGHTWRPLGDGIHKPVSALAVYDDGLGGGPALYVGGTFVEIDGIVVNHIARWDGSNWTPLGAGVSGGNGVTTGVNALTLHDDGTGSGPALYVCGEFTQAGGQSARYVARWDGQSWTPLGGGVGRTAYALAVFDDGLGAGPELHVGGRFTFVSGQSGVAGIAKWDGTSWGPVGGGLDYQGFLAPEVYALAITEDGDGGSPALYAGGRFSSVEGGHPAVNIAKWNGQSWSELGSGLSGSGNYLPISALGVFDDGSGSGPALFAAGSFTQPFSYIAKWDGQDWSSLGSGLNSHAMSLTAYDDGSGDGPVLHVGGSFTSAGGQAANGIAKWDGQSWSALGSGPSPGVRALAVFEDGRGGGPALFAGGGFAVNSFGDSYLAKWSCSPPPALGAAYCFGDGSGTACPCGNAGSAGEGCANSTSQGAVLSASGSASASAADLALAATNLPAGQFGLFFQATGRANGGDGIVLGDGLFCASGPTVRLEVAAIDAAGTSSTTVDIASLGGLTGGETRTYQLWYRDTAASPCGNGFNTSNGLELVWEP